jgi:hypothetical protein
MERLKRIRRQRQVARHDDRKAAIEQIYLSGIRKALAHAQLQMLHKFHAGTGKTVFLNDAQFSNADPVAVDFMFDLDDFAEMFFAEMREAGESALEISGQGLLSELGIDRKYVTPHGLMRDFTVERQNKLSQVPQEIWDTVKSSVEDGIRGGMSADQMADQVVNDTFGQIQKGRAVTVARTETSSVYNTGRMDAMRQHGITHKSWLTADDERVRHEHSNAEAQGPIPIDQKFSNGLRYPGDPNGSAAQVINCRCTVEAREEPQ